MKKTFALLILLLISLYSFCQYSNDSASVNRSYLSLSADICHADSGISFISVPRCIASTNFNTKHFYMGMIGFDLLLYPNGEFADVLFGQSLQYAPFENYLFLNFEYDLSYGIAIWNNFSGMLKPGIELHIPIIRKTKDDVLTRYNLFAGAGFYQRFSGRVIGYLGHDRFYDEVNGYFIRFGISMNVQQKGFIMR